MLNQQEERKKFEARVLLRKPDACFTMKKGRYVDRAIQFRWAGWLDKAHDGAPPSPSKERAISWNEQDKKVFHKVQEEVNAVLAGSPRSKPIIVKNVIKSIGFAAIIVSVCFVLWYLISKVP